MTAKTTSKKDEKLVKVITVILTVAIISVIAYLLYLPAQILNGIRPYVMKLVYEYLICLSVLSWCLGGLTFMLYRLRKK